MDADGILAGHAARVRLLIVALAARARRRARGAGVGAVAGVEAVGGEEVGGVPAAAAGLALRLAEDEAARVALGDRHVALAAGAGGRRRGTGGRRRALRGGGVDRLHVDGTPPTSSPPP